MDKLLGPTFTLSSPSELAPVSPKMDARLLIHLNQKTGNWNNYAITKQVLNLNQDILRLFLIAIAEILLIPIVLIRVARSIYTFSWLDPESETSTSDTSQTTSSVFTSTLKPSEPSRIEESPAETAFSQTNDYRGGFANAGNTCYAAATLQSLLSSPAFMEYLKNDWVKGDVFKKEGKEELFLRIEANGRVDEIESDSNIKDDKDDVKRKQDVEKRFENLLKAKKKIREMMEQANSKQTVGSMKEFVECVNTAIGYNHFEFPRQEDANELFVKLAEILAVPNLKIEATHTFIYDNSKATEVEKSQFVENTLKKIEETNKKHKELEGKAGREKEQLEVQMTLRALDCQLKKALGEVPYPARIEQVETMEMACIQSAIPFTPEERRKQRQEGKKLKFAEFATRDSAPRDTYAKVFSNNARLEDIPPGTTIQCEFKLIADLDATGRPKENTIPKMLVLSPKRFERSHSTTRKIEDPIEVEEFFLMPIAGTDAKARYKLMSAAHHSGSSGGGHYTALARYNHNEEEGWLDASDSYVSFKKNLSIEKLERCYVYYYQYDSLVN